MIVENQRATRGLDIRYRGLIAITSKRRNMPEAKGAPRKVSIMRSSGIFAQSFLDPTFLLDEAETVAPPKDACIGEEIIVRASMIAERTFYCPSLHVREAKRMGQKSIEGGAVKSTSIFIIRPLLVESEHPSGHDSDRGHSLTRECSNGSLRRVGGIDER